VRDHIGLCEAANCRLNRDISPASVTFVTKKKRYVLTAQQSSGS